MQTALIIVSRITLPKNHNKTNPNYDESLEIKSRDATQPIRKKTSSIKTYHKKRFDKKAKESIDSKQVNIHANISKTEA